MPIDLKAYFQRIGYDGRPAATLDTLRALHGLHPAAIPFENLSSFAALPVPLDLPSLEQKLLRDARGGYCFEQNTLFLEVLQALGFRVSALGARVLWGQPADDAITPRSHALLKVELPEGTYLADVGFGVMVLTAPLKLELDTVQPTPHEAFRVIRGAEGEMRMQAQVRDDWKTLYRFDLTPAFPVDYEVSNWYVSTYPSSHFRTGLMIARAVPGRRYGLRNRSFSIHNLGGESSQRELATVAELVQVLERDFGIRVPRTTEMYAAFQRLF
ncbi:MAG TPA: arylamine N-acetyltransferase [Polyangiales bacterium]|nr:arylamine N-acetyltransferase [Polyangiales bacterium]